MAVVSNQQDPNQNNGAGPQQNGGSSAPVSVASAVAGPTKVGSSASTPAGTSGDNQNTSSGSFTNLKSYLNANSNYNNGQGLAGQVNNDLGNQAQNINSNINSASNQFNQQSQGAVQNVNSNYQNFEQGVGATSANNNTPDANSIYNYAKNGNNVATTQALEGAQYQGPQTLNDLSGANNGNAIQSSVQNYNSLVNNTNTEAGRENLLSSLYGGNGYNQGQQTLDNVFLQGANFGGAQAQGNQLNNAYTQANNNATAQGQANTQQVRQIANNVTGQLNNAVGNVNSQIANTFNTNLKNQAGDVSNAQQALQSGNISQSLATALGLTNGENVYNTTSNPTNLNNYISANKAYNMQDAATQDQYNQMAALNSLLGNYANGTSANTLAQYSGGMPTGNTGLLNYNGAQLQGDIKQAAQDYQNQSNPLAQAIQNNAGAYYSNVVANDPGITLNPYTGNAWVSNTGTTLDPSTLTAKEDPSKVNSVMSGNPLFDPNGNYYSNMANNLIQKGEAAVNASGGAGEQGSGQSYAGNYNTGQSQAYLNALSNLMKLNNNYDPTKTVNIQ